MKVAVEGCAHGELEKIYETIQCLENEEGYKVDLLLCCGDFQATRNLDDLQTMAVPPKYLDMCSFYKYYSGELVAPILTIFIGGNHEASNHLQELPYGGWVAPNIYYLGYAGVVKVNGIRIAGLSGIYKGHDYLRGRFEFAPYTDTTRTSVYHVRQLEVFRLKQLSGTIDIFMSHDWPRGIYNYGNKSQLARFKPHFRDEMDKGQLGSRPCEDLLKLLKPNYWFAAHLHCKFAAVVPHDEVEDSSGEADESSNENHSSKDKPVGEDKDERITKFLALDKCLPKRRFLQLLDIETPEFTEGEVRLEYDLEWLTILHLTNHLTNVKSSKYYLPGPQNAASTERYNFVPNRDEMENVRNKFAADLLIPKNFSRTVEPYNASEANREHVSQPKAQINPQSQNFCDALGIDDPVSLALIIGGHELSYSSAMNESTDTEFNDSTASMQTEQSSLNISSSTGDALSPRQISPFKRKSSLGLNLPKPIVEIDSAIGEICEEKNPDELQLGNSSADETDNEAKVAEDVNEEDSGAIALNAKPPIKKFKRRNQSVYMNEDKEDESG
ncbi:PREDICTED: lariat debranching enzyme [Rhagoletis zephyria]|uniref:lariat debranching enzyme n=1 Tax=Rhagoletis zephyria TaxID=28612 RepID=UPI000811817E|nr:PREDICTED: lariat debranching enzyme [Rhagoletis zephyria]XP_036339093.1 lariat debranching enzyme [Rhagoletis pomonella]